jgi:hypothetical protein
MSYILANEGGVLTLAPKEPRLPGVTMEVTGGRVVIPLNVVRPCERGVPLRGP